MLAEPRGGATCREAMKAIDLLAFIIGCSAGIAREATGEPSRLESFVLVVAVAAFVRGCADVVALIKAKRGRGHPG